MLKSLLSKMKNSVAAMVAAGMLLTVLGARAVAVCPTVFRIEIDDCTYYECTLTSETKTSCNYGNCAKHTVC